MNLAEIKDALAFWRPRKPSVPFTVLFKKFKSVLERNNRILELMADMGDKLGGEYVFDRQYINTACESMGDLVFKLISDLSVLSQCKNVELFLAFESIRHQIQEEMAGRRAIPETALVIPLENLNHDLSEEAGNKLAVLGDVRNILGLPTPDGFVVTTRAYGMFMESNGLTAYIDKALAGWDGSDQEAFERMSADIQAKILAAPLPQAIFSAIIDLAESLALHTGNANPRFAVRSSAWGEDGESSFAGQYATVLGVPIPELGRAYKRVVASAYSPEGWSYRLHRGYLEHEMAMAVGCQFMVGGEVSGGLYTYVPLSREESAMVVSGAWGLGAPIVDGTAETDTFVLSRVPPHAPTSTEISSKPTRMIVAEGGGTVSVEVPEERRDSPCLTESQLDMLAQAAMVIERFFKRPQDVEWTFDAKGNLYILQARPLNVKPRVPEACALIDTSALSDRVIFAERGLTVQRGVAAGSVYVVDSDEDLRNFPYGGILVSHTTSPRYARVMPKARGIITDLGSPTGHMATIAREHRLPTLVNTGVATELLKTGDVITLDTAQNAVYRGIVADLCRFEITEEDVYEESYEYRLLRRILKRITPLGLVDPMSDAFRPANCRTYHDITRFVHERAVEELIKLSESAHSHTTGTTPKRLVTDMPLGLVVIDAEGGLTGTGPTADSVTEDNIASAPLKSILRGVRESNMWSTEPVAVDLKSFMSSFTRTSMPTAPKDSARNLVVVSEEYMNMNLKLGYHYTIIDAYLSEAVNDNYVYFRFLGGVTDFVRRTRRARCIADILERYDFRVEVRGDLVVGRVKKLSKRRMLDKMKILGGLIGYTRQLDVLMHGDDDMAARVADFVARIEPILEVRHDNTE